MKFSTEYISAFVALIIFVAGAFKVNLDQDGLTTLVTEIIGIGSAIYLLYKRYKRGDIKIFGMRK